MRITESQLRSVVKKLVKEQTYGVGDEDPYYTFVTEMQPGGDDDMLADAADLIRDEVRGDGQHVRIEKIMKELMQAAREAGYPMDEDDAEAFAYDIVSRKY